MAASGDAQQAPKRSARSVPPVRRIAIGELMGGGREAVLLHDGIEYRLRLTSNGKLILTK
ncbi:MAG TPA: hemin uptake protein HemP [Rhizomicrobium sp.]|jgi:hemin uptake protein HemP|nr:hemin uptake protein HemP [Rhizomicrobium sp.]